jgi:hypothetical protein
MHDVGRDAFGEYHMEPQLWFGLEKSHWVTIGAALLAALMIAFGWVVAANQQYRNRQQEMKVAYLVDAYDKLALSANRELTPEFATMLETATAKIQLFGSPEEIRLLHRFLDEWGKNRQPARKLGPATVCEGVRNKLGWIDPAPSSEAIHGPYRGGVIAE